MRAHWSESDSYELFCDAEDAGTHFLLRTCMDRLAGDGEHTIATEIAEVDCKGLHLAKCAIVAGTSPKRSLS